MRHPKIEIGSFHYVKFPEGNSINYFQDMRFHAGVPHGVMFFPREATPDSIVFIGDGYGIIGGNEYGLTGKYGNGAIFVDKKDISSEVLSWCTNNLLIKKRK